MAKVSANYEVVYIIDPSQSEEAIAASENQRSGSLIYSLYMMGNTMPLADQVCGVFVLSRALCPDYRIVTK